MVVHCVNKSINQSINQCYCLCQSTSNATSLGELPCHQPNDYEKMKRPLKYFLFPFFCLFSFGTFILSRSDRFQNSSSSGNSNNECQCEESPPWRRQLAYQSSLPPTEGRRTSEDKKFLAIGISTVFREANYLQQTLESLVNESEESERVETVVLIYLADTETLKKEKQKERVRRDFQAQLDSGFFQVIESSGDIYPSMDFALSRRTFNDSLERVTWRTKQVIDFAFVFSHAKRISTYTLILEDDVLSATSYITAIRDFIQHQSHLPWVALHFSHFTGIALLFQNSHLHDLTHFLLLFHREKPVDELMRQFIDLKAPKEILPRRFPSLFQHFGISSTLSNKTQNLTDDTFDLARRRFRHQNPPADLFTSMTVANNLIPEYAYRQAPGVFVGKASASDTFDIVFHNPLRLRRVLIVTGLHRPNETRVSSVIAYGTLQASPTPICDGLVGIAEFKEGEVDVRRSLVGSPTLMDSVWCLRISIEGPHKPRWVIIREIQVFVDKQASKASSP